MLFDVNRGRGCRDIFERLTVTWWKPRLQIKWSLGLKWNRLRPAGLDALSRFWFRTLVALLGLASWSRFFLIFWSHFKLKHLETCHFWKIPKAITITITLPNTVTSHRYACIYVILYIEVDAKWRLWKIYFYFSHNKTFGITLTRLTWVYILSRMYVVRKNEMFFSKVAFCYLLMFLLVISDRAKKLPIPTAMGSESAWG